jgi:hypothetical protein
MCLNEREAEAAGVWAAEKSKPHTNVDAEIVRNCFAAHGRMCENAWEVFKSSFSAGLNEELAR